MFNYIDKCYYKLPKKGWFGLFDIFSENKLSHIWEGLYWTFFVKNILDIVFLEHDEAEGTTKDRPYPIIYVMFIMQPQKSENIQRTVTRHVKTFNTHDESCF